MAGTVTSGLQISTTPGKHDVLFSWVQTRNRRKAYSMSRLAWPAPDIHCEENLTHSNPFGGGGSRCEPSWDPRAPTSSSTSGADTHQTPADLHIPGALGAGNAAQSVWAVAPSAQPLGECHAGCCPECQPPRSGGGEVGWIYFGAIHLAGVDILHERNQRPGRAKERSIYGGSGGRGARTYCTHTLQHGHYDPILKMKKLRFLVGSEVIPNSPPQRAGLSTGRALQWNTMQLC